MLLQVGGGQDHVMSVLNSLPGVDTEDPALQDAVKALEQMGKEGKNDDASNSKDSK